MSNPFGIVEVPSYSEFSKGPIGELSEVLIENTPLDQMAYMILQDYGPNMYPCVMHIMSSALEADKFVEVVKKLKQIFGDYQLFWIWPPSLPDYLVEEDKTVRELIKLEICQAMLGLAPTKA